MIENMRKYTGLMVVVLVLLAAGLVITMKPGGSGGGVGSSFMNVNGVTLDQNDYRKAGQNTIGAIQRLAQTQNYTDFFKLRELPGSLSGNPSSESQSYLNFVTNRILLKQNAQKLGIYASTEAAATYIQDNMFKGQDGSFDAQSYSNYISSLGNLGLKQQDFEELIAEYIVFTKTRDLLGGGLTPAATETLAQMKAEKQDIGLSTVSFQLADFKKDIVPSEEKLKAYWETHKDRYQTDRQLKVTYVLSLLDDSDEPQRPTPAADADPAEVSKQNLAYQEKLAAWNEQRKGHTKLLTKIFSAFTDSIADADFSNFDKAAATAKEQAGEDIKVVSTAAFTAETAPAELAALKLKHEDSQLVSKLFSVKVQNDISFDTKSYSVGRDGHITVRIDEEIQPKVKSFEDAKALASADLITELANSAMTSAAEKAQKELTELITAGKSFAEAATEKGFTAVSHKPFNIAKAPTDLTNAADLFRIAQVTNPKTIATELASSESDKAIVYVDSRSIEVAEDTALTETQTLDSASNQLKYIAFNAWINSLKDDAELALPLAN